MLKRYIQDRFLPDKAIDVIDEAASKVNLNNNELIELVKLQQELKETGCKKIKPLRKMTIKKAADLKVQEIQLQSKISEVEKASIKYLEAEDVASVIENWTKKYLLNILVNTSLNV